MPCEVIRAGDRALIACRGPRRRKRCETQGCNGDVVALCDFRVAFGKSCDRAMCESCRTRLGTNLDHCPEHRERKVAL